jgi:hypothetical protein
MQLIRASASRAENVALRKRLFWASTPRPGGRTVGG